MNLKLRHERDPILGIWVDRSDPSKLFERVEISPVSNTGVLIETFSLNESEPLSNIYLNGEQAEALGQFLITLSKTIKWQQL